MIRSLAAVSLLLASTAAIAQAQGNGTNAERPKWDVNSPPGIRTRSIPINVDEGTWMNLDVSPDGRTIAFDLLGDLYTMPITGGRATRITSGLSYDQQPRFSPDGRQISFTTYTAGGVNILFMTNY